MKEKTFFDIGEKIITLPINIGDYKEDLFFFTRRNPYQRIVLRRKKNVITSTANVLFKYFILCKSFHLKKYSDSHLTVKTYISFLLKYITVPRKKLKGEYLWICEASNATYYHWVMDVLIKIIGLKSIYKELPVLLISENTLKVCYIKETLDYYEIKYLTLTNQYIYSVEKVVTPITERNDRVFNVDNLLFAKQFFSKLFKIKKATKRIYISRRIAEKRKIVNETEVESILEKYRIESIITEKLSFKEQFELFSQTNFLISIHGAGLVNQIFMPLNSTIIEIRNAKMATQPFCFFDIARALNNKYYYIKGEPTGEDIHTSDIIVDTKKMELMLETYFKS